MHFIDLNNTGLYLRHERKSINAFVHNRSLFLKMVTWAEGIINFYRSLRPPGLPPGVEILFPQSDENVMKLVEFFFRKFYNDHQPRRLVFGINPGRFGAGTTGINFTAPKQLKEFCGIDHSFRSQTELSAEFIYEMIAAYGGPPKFYKDYFITSVSPLGFVKDGVNMNYYDDKDLLKVVEPFIIDSIQKQLALGFKTDKCFCIGGDKNLKFFLKISEEHNFFKQIIPLPHPRFIMQYRRKQKQQFIDQYLQVLS